MDDPEDVVLLSEIEHFAYCSRQWALISLERTWCENASTMRGSLAHERVDLPATRQERGMRVLRGLTVWSDRDGLFGRADVVEFDTAGLPMPIEHKSGKRFLVPARLQLAGQALCLEEMFHRPVALGAIWLGGRRKRINVPIDDTLRSDLRLVLEDIRLSRTASRLPAAAFDARCADCSLIDDCLPQLVSDQRGLAISVGMLFSRLGSIPDGGSHA